MLFYYYYSEKCHPTSMKENKENPMLLSEILAEISLINHLLYYKLQETSPIQESDK